MKEKVKQLVASGKVKEAIQLFLSRSKSESQSEGIRLLSEFETNERQFFQGILSRDDYSVIRNRIVYSLLGQLESNDLGKQTATVSINQNRKAVVIGCNGYHHLSRLNNARNDAELVHKVLKARGISSSIALDPTKRELELACEGLILDRGEEQSGILFFAGHGVQIEGEIFIAPIDAKYAKVDQFKDGAISLTKLVGSCIPRQPKGLAVIIDACRDNPLSRNVQRSELPKKYIEEVAGSGTLISYSTSPNSRASDGSERNSPFTKALTELLTNAPIGADFEGILMEVRKKVIQETNDDQIPWESKSLLERFLI